MKEMFSERLEFFQNNFYFYGEYALVGTKGYCYEGKDTIEHFEKLRSREIERLRVSLEMAKKAGYQKFTGMILEKMRQRMFYAFHVIVVVTSVNIRNGFGQKERNRSLFG